MKYKIYAIFLAVLLPLSLFPATAATAADNQFNGTVELGARFQDDVDDSALFQEYRSFDDDIIGGAQLNLNLPTHYLRFYAERSDSDDQSYQLVGGRYGFFKYQFDYSDMPHNYYFDARTPATGLGTGRLMFPLEAAVPPVAEWHEFDYRVDNQSYGGELRLSFNTPFYLQLGMERREQDGLRPYSTRQFIETGEPVETTLDTFTARLGYAGENISAAVTGYLSEFENDIDHVLWDDPNDGLMDLVVFSPDNEMSKAAIDFSWRNLPLASVFSAGASISLLESDYTADDIGFDITNSKIISPSALPFNRYDYDGEVEYRTVSLSLLSRPLPKLSTKFYYRRIERDNNSSIITYDGGDITNADELLSYDKDVAGINIDYRLPGRNKLSAGYEYANIDRSTPNGDGIPTDETRDDTFFLQFRNMTFDWMTAKLRYTYKERESSRLGRELSSTTPNTFYYMDQSSNQVKLLLEFYPSEQFDIGLDMAYKRIDYDRAIDTRQDEEHQSLYLDAAWRATGMLTLMGFVGLENIETEANRVTSNQLSPVYGQDVEEDYWTVGLGARFKPTDRLSFNLSWLWQESDGSVNFDNSVTGTSFVDIDHSDDYTRQQVKAGASYKISDHFNVSLDYLYEKFDYDDLNFEHYPSTYIIDGDNYLSGLYSDQDYDVQIGVLRVSYSF